MEERPEYFSSSARGLSLAGLVLFALYGSILLGSLFPIQLMAPAWQLKVGSALINASPFPLIGLGLLHLAADLDPNDEVLIKRHSLASRLAVAVSLGFFLLVPLMSVAAVVQQQQRSTGQFTQIRRAETNLQALSQVVSSSNNSRELRDRLIALNGPVINENNLSQPLPAIKAEVNDLLKQAAGQVARQRQQLPISNPWSLFPELLRNAFASLALAVGFGGLAWRKDSEIPFLVELQLSLKGFLHRKRSNRGGTNSRGADPDYVTQLLEGEDIDDQPPSASQP